MGGGLILGGGAEQFNITDPPNEDVERGTFPEKWGRFV